jgi:hypothetical protein
MITGIEKKTINHQPPYHYRLSNVGFLQTMYLSLYYISVKVLHMVCFRIESCWQSIAKIEEVSKFARHNNQIAQDNMSRDRR